MNAWGHPIRSLQAGPRHARSLATIVLALLVCVSASVAAETSDEDAVRNGRDALRGASDFPWYDAKTDDVRGVGVEPLKQPPKQNPATATGSTSSGGDTGWFQWLAWILIGLLLAMIAYVLIRTYLLRENRAARSGDGGDVELPGPGGADRVESLPFAVPRPKGDLLSEAQRCYEAGDFRLAVIYLYSYQLLQLDKHQWIHLAKGKTNREYLRELRTAPARPLLETTMVTFEDAFFGNHTIARERFEACWRGLPQFEQLIQQVAA